MIYMCVCVCVYIYTAYVYISLGVLKICGFNGHKYMYLEAINTLFTYLCDVILNIVNMF